MPRTACGTNRQTKMHKESASKPKKAIHHVGHKKVFDVTRPGKSIAPSNSRSVITSHKPPVPDDQFVPGAPKLRASDPNEKHELLNSKHKKDLSPLTSGAVAPNGSVEVAHPAQVNPEASPATVGNALDAHVEATLELEAPSAPLVPNNKKTDKPNTLPEKEQVVTGAPEVAAPMAPVAASPTEPAQDIPEETPAHLIMEQTVRTEDTDLPIWENPETSQQNSQSSLRTSSVSAGLSGTTGHAKTIEDLLAETGAPTLEPDKEPALVVSHHHKHVPLWERILIFLFVLLLAALTLNFLLDAEVIRTSFDLPHTDLL